MEMKIIPANGGGPGMDGVFLSGYGDGDYTPRPRSGPLPSLPMIGLLILKIFLNWCCISSPSAFDSNRVGLLAEITVWGQERSLWQISNQL